jgi:hypothetical protein
MPGISRVGDNVYDGAIITGSSNSFCNNKPIATVGSAVSSHTCCGLPGCGGHCSATIISGSGKVMVNGKPVCRQGDSASCGHTATGTQNVNCG